MYVTDQQHSTLIISYTCSQIRSVSSFMLTGINVNQILYCFLSYWTPEGLIVCPRVLFRVYFYEKKNRVVRSLGLLSSVFLWCKHICEHMACMDEAECLGAV
ncbi:hypothetical protein Mp_5g09950 [Marchantia polymorpha subsp. ruderalis]|uniref:Uncharacterized protein n=2 Tax=Marchantia polymorpha TaxID=3197 RepID=A0AAF6BGR8_MARPO|nr:hypothetical protein MARPO_0048s0076 [Marchantia polymorpha]BBN11202.1 hypothetical protein Mp_5g09950 [Marchantia polymorpha subsp. ruderalis]|eukprot:PTQ38967.1 hypothetical protein MARPO_0048s0076 [Marchantia polymorpha]